MSARNVAGLANEILIPEYQAERHRLDGIDGWWHWDPEKVDLPARSNSEHTALRDVSEDQWLNLVVTTVAQQLAVEGVRSARAGADIDAIWEPWLKNRMPSRQKAIHYAATGYGYSYVTVKPGDRGAVMRGRSPREVYAVYADATVDEYPMYYVDMRASGPVIVDEEAEYFMAKGRLGYELVEARVHGVGVAPLVRYSNNIDLEARTPGEVEPYIATAKRINKTTYDRMLTQHFNSWKVRTATGLDEPANAEDAEQMALRFRQNDILTGGPDVQFGTLDETPLDGFISAKMDDVRTLAATSQTPSHALTGDLINLSADAISESRAMLDLKAGERKRTYGDSHAQALRLAAHIEGREEDAADFTISMQWADLEARSMTQAADALGKIATMLGVPVEKLWDRIPGVSVEEARAWREYREQNPSADERLSSALMAQANGTDG